jgi:uncharacterized protein YbbC (DUF1343 family)
MASPSVPEPRFGGQDVPGVRFEVEQADALASFALGVHVLEELTLQARAQGQGPLIDNPQLLDLLAGSTELRRLIEGGGSVLGLPAAWDEDEARFEQLRGPYLLYP